MSVSSMLWLWTLFAYAIGCRRNAGACKSAMDGWMMRNAVALSRMIWRHWRQNIKGEIITKLPSMTKYNVVPPSTPYHPNQSLYLNTPTHRHTHIYTRVNTYVK